MQLYRLGYHPLFHAASSLARIAQAPVAIGTIASLLGFAVAAARRLPKLLPDDVMESLRREQVGKLARMIHGRPIQEV